MAQSTSFKVRHGNAIPIMAGSSMTNAFVWTFGSESQEIEACESTAEVLASKDMCLLGGEYFSAQYKAHPGKANGSLVFNSVLAKKPNYSQDIPNGGGQKDLCDF